MYGRQIGMVFFTAIYVNGVLTTLDEFDRLDLLPGL